MNEWLNDDYRGICEQEMDAIRIMKMNEDRDNTRMMRMMMMMMIGWLMHDDKYVICMMMMVCMMIMPEWMNA